MSDTDRACVAFLQWALPQLHMRWPGFRRVHRRVCRRLTRRLSELRLDGLEAYRLYLEENPGEWARLDQICRITITRFYRDRRVFALLRAEVLPQLAERCATIRAWSIGCASGEEPYTLALLWHFELAQRHPHATLDITATDINPELLARARQGLYAGSAIKAVPEDWRQRAFTPVDDAYQLELALCPQVHFALEDIRQAMPAGPFDLILCRNLVFTYFDQNLQAAILARLRERLAPGGVLVLGRHEVLPPSATGFAPWAGGVPVYRRVETG
ncbi:MAG: CheR family methyltransferase [Pseudomonadota bacterium]